MSVFIYAGTLSTAAVSTGTTTTMTSTFSTWTASQWIDETFRLDDGAQVGISRIITANTTDKLTFAPALPSAPTSNENFRVARTLRAVTGSVSRSVREIGDRHRGFDGTLRTTIRSRVSDYSFRTTPLTFAAASCVETTLTSSTQPVECGGDLFSTGSLTNCVTSLLGWTPIHAGDGNRMAATVTLSQSS